MMLRAVNAVVAALFAAGAALQWNDPDPARWMALYGAACAISLMAARGRPPRRVVPAALAGIAIAWAVAVGVRVGGDSYLHMFDAWEMRTPAIEEARETSGLLIVAGWMVVIAATPGRPKRS
jgi:hypothetical protein